MRSRTVNTMAVLAALAALALWLAPSEQILGNWVKLIYLHSSLSYAGLYGIYGAGLLGAVYLATKKEAWGAWSRELIPPALTALSVSVLLSLAAMQAAWGGLFLREPRTIASLIILGLGCGKEILASGAALKVKAGANALFAAAVFLIRLNLPYVMHPESPIRSSDSLAIRLFPLFLVLLSAAAIGEYARWKLTRPDK